MKFNPHNVGSKKRVATHDTVRDHTLNDVQKTCKFGADLVAAMSKAEKEGNVNLTHYRITRAERDKLYQPWIPYVASDLKELDLSFIAESKDDHFNDVYQIMPNDSVVEYECPLGWVFQDSNNISNFAYCRNWTWTVDFDTEKPCIRRNIIHYS